jgi:O-antigen/teichoic acid export membrane protein
MKKQGKAPPTIMRRQFHSLYPQVLRFFTWILYSKQASLAIADQAVISLSSLLLSVVIARMAGIDLLGSVAFILVLSVFGGTALASLVSAPAMVLFGSMKDDERRYRGFLFLASVSIGTLSAAVLSLIYVIYRQRSGAAASADEICMIALLFVLIPVQDTLRRTAFARARPWAGLRLTVLRSIPPPVALLCAFPATHPMSLFDVVLVLAIASGCSIVVELVFDRLQIPDRQFSIYMWHRHWDMSRWLLLSSFLNSAYEQIFTVASGIAFGDRAVAIIRISQQLFGVVFAGMQTFENTLPRQLALAAVEESKSYASLVRLLASLVFLGVGLLGGLLWWFGNDLISFVFNIDYQNYANLLLFWAVSTAVNGARMVYTMAFRAIRDTKPIFVADSCSFLAGASLVIPLLYWFGVVGSGIGMLVTSLVGLGVMLLSLQQASQRSHEKA